MKTIILYCRRQTGVAALLYLVAKGYRVFVISDDENVIGLARELGVGLTTLEVVPHLTFDLFLCVHGNKLIPKEYLVEGKFVNVHPCLYKYKGHNPIKRYILGMDTDATVEAHFMTDVIDDGQVIYGVKFETPVCKTYAEFYNVALKYYFTVIKNVLIELGL